MRVRVVLFPAVVEVTSKRVFETTPSWKVYMGGVSTIIYSSFSIPFVEGQVRRGIYKRVEACQQAVDPLSSRLIDRCTPARPFNTATTTTTSDCSSVFFAVIFQPLYVVCQQCVYLSSHLCTCMCTQALACECVCERVRVCAPKYESAEKFRVCTQVYRACCHQAKQSQHLCSLARDSVRKCKTNAITQKVLVRTRRTND